MQQFYLARFVDDPLEQATPIPLPLPPGITLETAAVRALCRDFTAPPALLGELSFELSGPYSVRDVRTLTVSGRETLT